MKIKVGILTAVATLLFFPGVVIAQSDNSDTGASEPSPGQASEARRERINKYVEDARETLSETKQVRIAARCEAAQTRLEAFQEKIEQREASIKEKNIGLETALNNLVDKLQAAGVDTTEIEAAIVQVKTYIASLDINISKFSETIGDLVAINCSEDPEGFYSALLAARQNRETDRTNVGELRSYITETLKPLLQTIKDSLQNSTDEEV